MSKNWLYRRAGRTIPVTRLAWRLLWTEEQISWIIEAAAIEPMAPFTPVEPRTRTVAIRARRLQELPPLPATAPRLMAKTPKTRRVSPAINPAPIPVANYTVSRLYRDQHEDGHR
ncbi:hypothetical protein [Nonomuraea sp. GTA35]|uniref:hypothetical protein n=1 Tax=Nonomuraea sp. GTA35 TaxID=1676746 RepID=UPI0035C23A30